MEHFRGEVEVRQVLRGGVPLCLVVLALAGEGRGQGFDARVRIPPERLGTARTEELLERTFPGMQVIPTKAGELVLSGQPSVLDQAEALLRKIDRPVLEVVVELHRGAVDLERAREGRLALNGGGSRVPSTARRTRSRGRSGGTQSLRVREGSTARFFIGSEVAYPVLDGLGTRVQRVSAGKELVVELVRVDPGKGVLLGYRIENSRLGAPTPAGPTVHRERIASTRTYLPFGRPVPIGGLSGGETSSLGGPSLSGRVGLVEELRRMPDGSTRPTGRFRRLPLEGALSAGRSRSSRVGRTGYSLSVRPAR